MNLFNVFKNLNFLNKLINNILKDNNLNDGIAGVVEWVRALRPISTEVPGSVP